jgi:hypothetical protein
MRLNPAVIPMMAKISKLPILEDVSLGARAPNLLIAAFLRAQL